jgi:hypothetical protein
VENPWARFLEGLKHLGRQREETACRLRRLQEAIEGADRGYPMTAPSAMLSKLKSLPGVPAGTWPNANAFAGAAMNPMQFWMQWAEQCQKAWADAVGVGVGGHRRR